MLKSTLSLAVVALFAAGCSTPQPVARQQPQPMSYVGSAGASGATGPAGMQAPGGSMVAVWTPIRDYTFVGNSDDILRSDSNKAREIADYLNQNPSARIAIDGPNDRYVHSVVDALKDAGVPACKIQTGAFGNARLRTDRRVEVLVSAR